MDTRQEEPELRLTPPAGLHRKHGDRARFGGFAVFLLMLLLLLQGVVLIALLTGPNGALPGGPAATASASPEVVKAQALRLEEMGVAVEAAKAWERFLEAGGGGGDAERALVRYRTGKLWQEAGRPGDALAAYVRAEREGLEDTAAKQAVGPRVIDCLRALSHYGAIGSELRKRVGGRDEKDASPVVAYFAGETLTRARFDRILEREIESALEPYADRLDPDALKAERERLVKMYRAPDRAGRLLKDVVMREVMVRRARELKLDREEGFREKLREVEGLLLMKRLRDREVTAGLKPTASDIEGFHAVHKEDYKTPPQARLSIIQVESEPAGRDRLASLKSGEDFAASARKSSLHEASREAGGAIETPLRKGEGLADFGYSAELEAAVFEAAPGTVLDRPFEVGGKVLLVRVDKKIPPAVPPLEEVRDRVRADYMEKKRGELLEALLKDLTGRYQVRYNLAGLGTDSRDDGSKKTAAEQKENP